MSSTADDLRRCLIIPSSQIASSFSSSPAVNLSSFASTRVDEKEKADMAMKVKQPATLTGELKDVFRIEDYMAAQEAERAAQIAARKATQQMQQQQSKKPKPTGNNALLQPIAVGARSSDHTVTLHDKLQKLGIAQPVFEYSQRGDVGWTVEASLSVTGVEELRAEFEEEGIFNSKQEAKEAICKRILEFVVALENEGKVKKPEKAKKRNVSAAQQEVQGEDKEPFQNYVGQLLGAFISLYFILVNETCVLIDMMQSSNAQPRRPSQRTLTSRLVLALPVYSLLALILTSLAPSTLSTRPRKLLVKKPPATLSSTSRRKTSGLNPSRTLAASRRKKSNPPLPRLFPPSPPHHPLPPTTHPTQPQSQAKPRTPNASPNSPPNSPSPPQNGSTPRPPTQHTKTSTPYPVYSATADRTKAPSARCAMSLGKRRQRRSVRA